MTTLLLAIIYIAFISLGLPDSVLGSAWPFMYPQFNVPVGWAGWITMIISAGTIVSSLFSGTLMKKFSTGVIMLFSVMLTAVTLLGFSFAKNYWVLCLIAFPYGLGAGSVDASLNNYVSLHYKARHMSWLHCFWGVGTMVGPVVMSSFLASGGTWNSGYRTLALIQTVLVVIFTVTLPVWKKAEKIFFNNESALKPLDSDKTSGAEEKTDAVSVHSDSDSIPTIKSVLAIPGVKALLLCFLCYSGIEASTGLWASTYMKLARGISEVTASRCAILFYIGISAGRFISGFISEKLGDKKMIISGLFVIAAGIVLLLLPLSVEYLIFAGFILIGLGCAPIYPAIIHNTPFRFGAENSKQLIGVQMACAYTGQTFLPLATGFILQKASVQLLPAAVTFYMVCFTVLFIISFKRNPGKN